jgi:hypothetical protein
MTTLTAKDPSQSERAVTTIAFCIVGGSVGIALYAIQSSSLVQFFSILGNGLLIAGACTLAGGLLGFLFGIPRTLQTDRAEAVLPNEPGQGQLQGKTISYQVNTNLEQISDWLTKILVGVGLTQLASLPEALQKFSEFASPALGGSPASKTLAAAILVFYTICGFLISYLWTRIYLAGALRQADLAVVGHKLAQMENKVSEIEKQAELDAQALSLVQRQLNPGSGSPPISQEEFNSTILPVSSKFKAQIYYLAQDARSQNWKDRQTKPVMERTVPIFRALIASDKDEIYHLNHGQLGFALKDQRQPDWAAAEAELNKAIEIRGPWESHGWLLYEFNRALCRINLDPAFAQGQEANAETKKRIVADLKAAVSARELEEIIAGEPTIQKWLTSNKIKWPKLG